MIPEKTKEELLAELTQLRSRVAQLEQKAQIENSNQTETDQTYFNEQLLNHLPNAILVADLQGRILQWSDQAERILGFKASEAVGQPISFIYRPDVKTEITAKMLEAIQSTGEFLEEVPCIKKDGSQVSIEILTRIVIKKNGQPFLLISIKRDTSESKQTEASLYKSEKMYRTLAHNFPNGAVFLFDHDLRYFLAAGKGLAEANLTSEMMEGKTIWEIFPPERCAILAPLYKSALAGEYKVTEIVLGNNLHAVYTLPILDENDQIICGMLMSQNINERKKAEEALKVSEERFRRLIRDLQVGVTIHGPKTEMIFSNRAAQELLDMSETQIIGKTIFDGTWNVINEDGSPFDKSNSPIVKAFNSGKPVHNVVLGVYRPRKKEWGWLLINCEPQYSSDSTVNQVICTFSDITERKRAEEERTQLIREQEARNLAEAASRRQAFLAEASQVLASSLNYETTLQSVANLAVPKLADWCTVHLIEKEDLPPVQVALAHVDPKKVQWALKFQREMEALFPYDPNATTGLPNVLRTGRSELFSSIPDEMLVEVAANEEQLQILREIGYSSVMIVPLVVRERVLGAIQFVATESGLHYTEKDVVFAEELAQRAAVAVDNSNLYRVAQNAVHIRDEFFAVAAHELKTPITSLRGFAQLLNRQLQKENGKVDTERLLRFIKVIEQQSDKLSQLITQLLDISRLETGKIVLDKRPTDIVQLVRNEVAMAEVTTSKHTIEVIASSEMYCEADPMRFGQVVSNLLNNAIKYSPEGGTIKVEITPQEDKWLRLAVTDQGIGIEPQERSRIFERFYQIRPHDYRSGLGLGLYISRELVHLHEGTIEAEFPDEGGTRFVILLPLDQDMRKMDR